MNRESSSNLWYVKYASVNSSLKWISESVEPHTCIYVFFSGLFLQGRTPALPFLLHPEKWVNYVNLRNPMQRYNNNTTYANKCRIINKF